MVGYYFDYLYMHNSASANKINFQRLPSRILRGNEGYFPPPPPPTPLLSPWRSLLQLFLFWGAVTSRKPYFPSPKFTHKDLRASLTLLFCWSWLACTVQVVPMEQLYDFEWSPPITLGNDARATSGKSPISNCAKHCDVGLLWEKTCAL